MNSRDEIIDWMRDAYAMERALENSLGKQANNDELSPAVRQQASAHLEETRRHAQEVRAALESLGTDTSAVKTGIGVMAEFGKSVGTSFAKDQRIKDLLTAYSMEHFEIACYTSLQAAAQQMGWTQVVEMCRRTIADEERMAARLFEALPTVTQTYLSEVQAKAA